MADATLSIELPEGPFYLGGTISLSLELTAEKSKQIPVELSSPAFLNAYTVMIRPGTPKVEEVKLARGAAVGQAHKIAVKSNDSAMAVSLDKAYTLEFEHPTVRFQSDPEVQDGKWVTVKLELDPQTNRDDTWAVVRGDCLVEEGDGWSEREEGYIAKFSKSSSSVNLKIGLKESGFADAIITLEAQANCQTAASGQTHDLGLKEKVTPKVSFAAPGIKADLTIDGDDSSSFRTGAATLHCKLDVEAPDGGASARITSAFFEGGPFEIAFSPGETEAEAVTVSLKDTADEEKSFALEAGSGCELDPQSENNEIKLKVAAPKLTFATPAHDAQAVPDVSDIYQIGEVVFKCEATYKAAGDSPAGSLIGNCFEEDSIALEFSDDRVLEGKAVLKDTAGKTVEVSIAPGSDYSLGPDESTRLEMQVAAPQAAFLDDQPDAKRVSGDSGPYQVGAATIKCGLNYAVKQAVAAVIEHAIIEGGSAELKFDPDATEAQCEVELLDSKDKTATLTLAATASCQVDKEKSTLEIAVQAPTLKFAADQPKAQRVSGDSGPYKSGPAEFTCELDYAAPVVCMAKIKSDFLDEGAIDLTVSKGETGSAAARGLLKDTAGAAEAFVIEPVSGCRVGDEGAKLTLTVAKPTPVESPPEVPPPETGYWITPYSLPFVEGEKATVKIVLTRPATGKGVTAKLKCPAFSSAYDVKIDEGESEKEIEVTFSSAQEAPDHEVVLEPDENCAIGTNFCRHVEVYPDRPVYFPSRGVVVPNGPFIKDDEAKITVDLLHPAPDKGAKAKLTGPFDKSPLTLEFERGALRQTVPLKFTSEGQEDQKITIEKVEGCITGTTKEHAIRIRTPKVEFDDPAVVIPTLKAAKAKDSEKQAQSKVELAGEAILKLKLDTPAPITGSSVRLTSEAFQEEKGYEISFPRLSTTADVTIRIKDDISLVDQTKKVELKTDAIRRCELGSKKTLDLEIKDCPRIRFANSAITPSQDVYKLASKGTLHIEPTIDPEEDVRVMVQSTAFGGKAHIVTLKKGPKAKVDQEVTFNRGYPANAAGEFPDQKVRLVAPEGWLADPTKTDTSQPTPEPNGHCILVKVDTETAENPQSCKQKKMKIIGGQPITTPVHTKPEEDEPDLDNPCNLHVMKLKIQHGDTTDAKPLKRGPDEDGTFEIVRDKALAQNPEKALQYSAGRIPVIEVTGGSEIADPQLPNPQVSPHYTTVFVEFDDADEYCSQQFVFGAPPTTDEKKGTVSPPPPRQHPFLHLNERVKGQVNRTAATIGKGYDLVTGAQKLPATIYNAGISIGQSLGLPVGAPVVLSGSEQPPGPAAPPLAQRYIWKPAVQALRFVRQSEIDKAKQDTEAATKTGKKGTPTKGSTLTLGVNPKSFPVFQARQVWFGKVQAGAKLVPGTKAATKQGTPPKAGGGPKAAPGADPTINKAEALAAQDAANAALLKKNLLAALSWAKMSPRQYWIDVESCGIPTTAPADKGGPNSRMQAMVEVYPSDEFCLHFEYNPDLPIMKTGAEGALFKPQKGCGEDGLKPVEKKPEEPSETEAEQLDEPVEGKLGWQDEEEPPQAESTGDSADTDGGDPKDEPDEVETDTSSEEDEVDVEPPTRGDGSAFLDEVTYSDTEKDAEPKKQSQVSFSPSLVKHPYKPPKAGINKSSASFVNQVVTGIQQNHTVDFIDHVGNTGIDQSAREQGDKARQFMDDNLFNKDCFNISLSRNGVSSPMFLEINKALGGLIGTMQEVSGVFNRFSGNWVPAEGWGIHLKLAFLEGKLDYYWGWKEHTDTRVFRWFSLQVFLTLLKLKFSMDFALRKAILMVKFELIVSGSLSLESVIDKGFERVNPDDKFPDWIDKWDSTEGLADIGARIVLHNENTCKVNAAVKTGFEFKYRLSVGMQRPFGVEYEIYFKGLTLDVAFKVKCLKEKRLEFAIIKGSTDDNPLASGFFPQKKPVRFKNLDNELNMLLSSVKAKRAVYHDKVTEYQNLQLKMVSDSKKNPDKYPYTEDGFLPGYRFDGEEGDREGNDLWKEQKKKWDDQWKECQAAFDSEKKKVKGRNSFLSHRISARLPDKVKEIEKIINEFISLLRGLDALRLRFIGLGDDIANADVEEAERAAKEKAFMGRLNALAADKNFKTSGNSQVKKLNGLLTDLDYYALKRTMW